MKYDVKLILISLLTGQRCMAYHIDELEDELLKLRMKYNDWGGDRMSDQLERLLQETGHILEKDSEGESNDWAYEDNFCNGYVCTSCGYEWCVNCYRDAIPSDIHICKGDK